MATAPGTIDFLLDQLGRRNALFTTKRMFGEYCVYRDGLPIAFVCDDQLFVKVTAPGRDAIASHMEVEFGPPYPGAKLYLRLSPDAWDDGDWLRGVLDATAAALPVPTTKPPKGAKALAESPRGPSPKTQLASSRKPKGAAGPTKSTKPASSPDSRSD